MESSAGAGKSVADALIRAVETYFANLRAARRLGAGTKERSHYPAVTALLAAIGAELKPRVLCLSDLQNTGAGHPDFGLYAKTQLQGGKPRPGQMPERGVIEAKGPEEDVCALARSAQVKRYFETYRLVVATNLRAFLIMGEGPDGRMAKLEKFTLAPTADAFWAMVDTPRASAERVGRAFGEYLKRALTHSVSLREPKDVAWFLASYARDGLARVEDAGTLPALGTVRKSLEEALGVKFEGAKGEHFFRSTLVQTLFYGVFSAWVLWSRQKPPPAGKFDWRKAIWHLHVPFVSTLFGQLANPKTLKPLGLEELLDWTAATLNRVEREPFFKRFNETDAVQFFYEPFLEAFDPELRRELGVWYTPNEVVTYMVARVDQALREDLGEEDGLASENVIVLDPCCGTGAYLAAVLKRIDDTLAKKGKGALKGLDVKKAALERVFGFEIMPAPFVVAHLQVGLVLQGLGAGLEAESERAGIYLTNSLTGWEPETRKPLPFPELEEERERAGEVKQDKKILVVLGNPPYNGFAGMAIAEERKLTEAYRTTKKVRKPEGQGLNDLYVRFFRMAERRIAEKTGKGVVCFISNYSWLDGLSFTGMRERFLEAFDEIRIDCLNGDKYKTGKTTPDGKPDPSIFSTEHNREGIQVGTAIATLVRKPDHKPAKTVAVRQFWGTGKRRELLEAAKTLERNFTDETPPLELGLPFIGATMGADYFAWPKLPDLLPVSFPGVKTSRDDFLVAIDREDLETRIAAYFDPKASHEEIKARFPSAMTASGRFDPVATREALLRRGRDSPPPCGEGLGVGGTPTSDVRDSPPPNLPRKGGGTASSKTMAADRCAPGIVRYAYRPFDLRWVYWEPETKLLDEKRAEYVSALYAGAQQIVIPKAQRKTWSPPMLASSLLDLNAMDGGAAAVPTMTNDGLHGGASVVNLPGSLGIDFWNGGGGQSLVFSHCLALLSSPKYFLENSGAMRADQPRVPLPRDADRLRASAALGQRLAALLDPETPAPGVTLGALRPGLAALAVPTKRGGGQFEAADLALAAGWGSTQRNNGNGFIVMPGRGRAVEREYTEGERAALALLASQVFGTARENGTGAAGASPPPCGEGLGVGGINAVLDLLGRTTFDIHLNGGAYWSNVPSNVWGYTLGGYQVIKKWLSYREQAVLGRALKPEEAAYVSEMVRRIAAIRLLGPALDANYEAAKANAVAWKDGRPAV